MALFLDAQDDIQVEIHNSVITVQSGSNKFVGFIKHNGEVHHMSYSGKLGFLAALVNVAKDVVNGTHTKSAIVEHIQVLELELIPIA
jgi:hypothetical protein